MNKQEHYSYGHDIASRLLFYPFRTHIVIPLVGSRIRDSVLDVTPNRALPRSLLGHIFKDEFPPLQAQSVLSKIS